MENSLQIFENAEFGSIRTIMVNEEPYFVGKDVAEILGYSDPSSAVSKNVDDEDKTTLLLEQDGSNYKSKTTIINESGLYSLILSSKLPQAKDFKHWITHEVLPSIRQYGLYATPVTIESMIADPDFAIKLLTQLKEEQQKFKEAQEKNKMLENEIQYKEDVIIGMVDDIDLATKRQRINQIVRHKVKYPKDIARRWNLLYEEFANKYHLNLGARFDKYKDEFKPKLKNNIDLIDRQMNMIPQLYEICCKFFENDVKALIKEWESTVTV